MSVNGSGDVSKPKVDQTEEFAKFSVEALRIDPATNAVKTTKQKTGMFVGRPDKQAWFQVSPDPNHHVILQMLELKTSDGKSELYACTPAAAAFCPEGFLASLFLASHKDTTLFLLLAKRPVGQKWDTWYHSLLEIVEIAKTKWVRVQGDQRSGTYDVIYPEKQFPPAVFPAEMSMDRALFLAFRGGRLIEDANHPALRSLRGAE